MAGITRYAHKQEALDAAIDELRHEFAALEPPSRRTSTGSTRVEEEIDWSTRIFQDRQQSLTYVCETPVILEQRAFALGRAIAALLPGVGGGRRCAAKPSAGKKAVRIPAASGLLSAAAARDWNPVDAGEASWNNVLSGRPRATWRACGPTIRSATC